MKYDCLIIDDEELLSESTCEYFNTFGVKTAWVIGKNSCREFLQNNKTDLILLDINLGNSSGFELCRQLRESTDIPIIFISARTSDDDLLLALNIGGDDYVQKPYSLAVLLAKVKAVLRRHQISHNPVFVCDNLQIDFENMSVHLNGQKIRMKTMEYKLLAYLSSHKNSVVSKDQIFRQVWGDSITSDNTLNVHIRHLREKIEANPREPRYIKTVWGTGYVFEVPES
ncbi:MAG: response regulator transcription factor [Dehalococcoidia bacterium]|nr:response regulator transcription factor [Dehalococcoidia bacterium]